MISFPYHRLNNLNKLSVIVNKGDFGGGVTWNNLKSATWG